jgi:hypothetical protein
MNLQFNPLRLAALTAAAIIFALPLSAEEAKPLAATPSPATAAAPPESEAKVSDSLPDSELTPEEKAEKDARKACKVDICTAFRAKKTDGPDIACSVVKSWRKEQLGKLVGKLKVSWPYGPMRCTSTVNMKRADLVKAMTDDKVELQLDKHSVSCVVEREKDAPTDIKFEFSPKVTFEKGKAISAKINWGKIEAPALVKSAMWTATAADNTINMLSGTLVADINDFIDKKCDEVKDQWAGK